MFTGLLLRLIPRDGTTAIFLFSKSFSFSFVYILYSVRKKSFLFSSVCIFSHKIILVLVLTRAQLHRDNGGLAVRFLPFAREARVRCRGSKYTRSWDSIVVSRLAWAFISDFRVMNLGTIAVTNQSCNWGMQMIDGCSLELCDGCSLELFQWHHCATEINSIQLHNSFVMIGKYQFTLRQHFTY